MVLGGQTELGKIVISGVKEDVVPVVYRGSTLGGS